MNRKIIITKFLLFLLFFSWGCGKKDTKIIATVNSIEIPFEDFKNRYEDYLISTGIKDTYSNRTNILNSMITEILLFNYSNNDSIFANAEYKREKNWIDKQTQLAFLKDREIYAKITTTEEELRDAFKKMNQQIEVRHLFTKTEEEANELYSLLQNGADFNLLAQQVFTDSTLRNNGGYLGFFSWGDFDPNFEQVAFNLPIGKISKPVKTEFGYSIIKVESKFTQPLITENEFITKKKQIERLVRINKKRPAEKGYLQNVLNIEDIKIDEKTLQQFAENLKLSIDEKEVDTNSEIIISDYRGKKFTSSYLMERITNLPFHEKKKIKSADELKIFIKGFYLNDALLQICKERGYDKNQYVLGKNKIQTTNLFMRYKQIEITKDYELSDSLISDFYNQHIEYFSTKPLFNLREIIVKEKNFANKLVNTLTANPKQFSNLAKKYSLRKEIAKKGGELGLSSIEKFGMIKNKIYNAKIGEIIGPLEIKGFYGIFQLIEKQESKAIPFDEISEKVTSAAKFFYRKQIMKNFSKNLFDTNHIDINFSILKDSSFLKYN